MPETTLNNILEPQWSPSSQASRELEGDLCSPAVIAIVTEMKITEMSFYYPSENLDTNSQ